MARTISGNEARRFYDKIERDVVISAAIPSEVVVAKAR